MDEAMKSRCEATIRIFFPEAKINYSKENELSVREETFSFKGNIYEASVKQVEGGWKFYLGGLHSADYKDKAEFYLDGDATARDPEIAASLALLKYLSKISEVHSKIAEDLSNLNEFSPRLLYLINSINSNSNSNGSEQQAV